MRMMKEALTKLLLLLFLFAQANGQEETNDTLTVDVDVSASGTTTDSVSSTGNGCICEGLGDLIPDSLVAYYPPGGLDFLSEYQDSLPDETMDGKYTCGDIQDLFLSGTECPDLSWMSYCCTGAPAYTSCAQNVRKQVLNGYDKLVIPTKNQNDPTKVTVQMTYQTVTDISESKGSIEFFGWLVLAWHDPRLAWDYDPSPNGTCTVLPVNARAEKQQGLKDSEIWVPEFDLMNQISGVSGMTGQLARVTNDGNVTWFRQGRLKAICQMVQLGRIPFDTLGCQMIMGSQKSGVAYELNPTGGLLVSNYAGPYNDFRLVHAQPGYSSNGGAVFFDLQYERGTSFYIQNILLPVAIFTLCSIGTMTIGVGAFQTCALNFTLLLVTVAQRIAVSHMLPVCNERLWLVDFVSGSFYFIVFVLVETFFKFIVLAHREHRQTQASAAAMAQDTEDGGGEEGPKQADDSWLETFSFRKLDVYCSTLAFSAYVLFLILMFSTNSKWGSQLSFATMKNGTDITSPY